MFHKKERTPEQNNRRYSQMTTKKVFIRKSKTDEYVNGLLTIGKVYDDITPSNIVGYSRITCDDHEVQVISNEIINECFVSITEYRNIILKDLLTDQNLDTYPTE